MPKMISKVLHEYAGRQLGVGDVFEAEDQHVEILSQLGRAEVDRGVPHEYATREMSAAPKRHRKAA